MLQDRFWGSLGLGRDAAAHATIQAGPSDDCAFCKACGAVTRTCPTFVWRGEYRKFVVGTVHLPVY